MRFLPVSLFLAVAAEAGSQCPQRPAANAGPSAQWVTASYRLRLADEMTLEDARRGAINRAVMSASAEANGVKMDGTTIRGTGEGAPDLFQNVVSATTSADMLGCEMLKSELVSVGESSYYDVTVRALIRPASSDDRPPLALNATLAGGKNIFFARTSADSSDEIHLEVRVSENAYIHVFNVYSDSIVQVLLPSRLELDNRLGAGMTLSVPSPAIRAAGGYRAALPHGKRRSPELFIIVATPEKIAFGTGPNRGRGAPMIEQVSRTELLEWLTSLARSQRAIAFLPYEIRAAR